MRARTFLTSLFLFGLSATPALAQSWTMWEGPQGGTRLRARFRTSGCITRIQFLSPGFRQQSCNTV